MVDPFSFLPELGEHRPVELARARQLDRHRVDEVAVDDDFVVQMRAGREAGLAKVADDLALRDAHAGGDAAAEARHVIVGRDIAVCVLDLDTAAIAGIVGRLDHDAVAGR